MPSHRASSARLAPSQVARNDDRWEKPLPLLHWATAALLLASFALAVAGAWIEADGWDALARLGHRTVGAIVFVLTVIRGVTRLRTSPPRSLAARRWQSRAATLLHAALYGLLVAIPVLGYLTESARKGTVHFIAFDGPALVPHDRALAETLQAVHQGLAWTLAAIVAAHVAAAAWHHFLLRDRTLLRMLGR